MTYNWQQPDWPHFTYDLAEVEDLLFSIAEKVGQSDGLFTGLPEEVQQETLVDMMVLEAIKTSEIEGEYLSRKDVMSSLRNNLGLNPSALPVSDRKADGVAKLMIAVRESFSDKLSENTLYEWHSVLMSGDAGITVGAWRDHQEPMQVISGPVGKEQVHYEAPPSSSIPDEMARFIQWFNNTAPGGIYEIKKPAVRSAITHLYFETIHPFEDGNGRIGRALSEKAILQGVGRPILFSLSRTIEENKSAYYEALKAGQRTNEITPWITYFVGTVLETQIQAEEHIRFILKKVKFLDRFSSQLNQRQLRVLQRMFESGMKGFEGGMSAKKYISITKTSKATSTRDLQDLVEKGALVPIGGGRSTRYEINLF